ncbi:glycosyltransferase [Mycobacterium sp. ACS4331]|uniref:glycosyltransferase n=1 Tax=Mycobacterium sp. ACS4331 TaxID=1834121 RepID=UPI0009ED293D|nr:glycosyltransferase [Mycobacterium sp. ACS4331]
MGDDHQHRPHLHLPHLPRPHLPAHLSARTVLQGRSLIRLGVAAVLIACLSVLAPRYLPVLLLTATALVYLVSTVDRNLLILKGLRSPSFVTISDEQALSIPDDELPVYTVLLPVYHEPKIVEDLINGVCRLDYPSDRLELLLLVEEDDTETQNALSNLPMENIRVVLVPHSLPKTKPKACNYGMLLPDRRGELVTIYDAEDIPDPLQLRRAVAAFRNLPEDVGCLQARLAYFNERQNLLTRWFSLEYDQWFGLVLPAVENAGCVVPLGGTSNHMPARVWHAVGGWDEFNVTEDADLGVRLARHGYKTLILDSTTLEEANSDVVNWIRQRSRWYKGYLQTTFVHLRHPLQLRREIGTVALLRLVNMTGAIPITSALNLVFWSTMVIWILGHPSTISALFPPFTYYICLATFIIGTPLFIFIELIVAQVLGKPYLWWAALLVPLYWFLQSVAALKAIYQLIFRPFFWEKTVHGLAIPYSIQK